MKSSVFDGVASTYATSRPGYPEQLYDAIIDTLDRPLAGSTVVDVGAGTGIATAALTVRGARVIAVDPAQQMLSEVHSALPTVHVVRADGDALPFGNATAHLVTYAQALHWTNPERAVPEAMRVLRSGGVLAAWWNVPDFDVPWVAEQRERLRAAAPTYHAFAGSDLGKRLGDSPFLLPVQHHRFRWSRQLSPEQHVTMLSTQSYLAALSDTDREAFLNDELALLTSLFPKGILVEPYVTHLTLVLQ